MGFCGKTRFLVYINFANLLIWHIKVATWLFFVITGADPENIHGRWLTGRLPIVIHILVRRGWLVNNGAWTSPILHCIKELVKGSG